MAENFGSTSCCCSSAHTTTFHTIDNNAMEVVDHANDLWSFCTTEEIISYYLSQPTDPNRVSLFYAHGIMDPQIQEILASDWFTELRFSSGSYNPHSFSIVDHFTDEESSRYRVLFLLETLRSQLQLFDSRTVLANATSGNGFDPFNHPSVSGIDALRKPLFKLSAEKLHLLMRDKKIGTESFALYRSIDNFYDAQEAKFKALGALSSRTDRHLWFVWTEHIPQSGITIRLILRHMVDSAPEIIVTVEHTLDNEDKKVIEEFDSQFNCDFNDLP